MDRPTTYLKYVVGRSKHLAGRSVGGVWRTGWVLVAAGRLIWVLVSGDESWGLGMGCWWVAAGSRHVFVAGYGVLVATHAGGLV